jgi:hypothetical protein
MRVGMFAFQPLHMPCDECGVSVAKYERDWHVCMPEDRSRFQAFQLRGELAGFEDELAAYLATPHGQFAEWDAERRRLDGAR